MFESIVSKITNTIRNAVRALGATTRKSPWIAPAVIVIFVLLV